MADTNHYTTPSEDPANQAGGATFPTPAPAIESHEDHSLSEPTQNNRENVLDGLKAPLSHLRRRTSVWLDKDITKVGGLYFQSMADAKASADTIQWRAPAFDDTIPKTDKEHQDIVKRLVQAFKHISAAPGEKDNVYRKRFTEGDATAYPDWAIEACAWNIVEKAKLIHTEGFKAPIFDKRIIDFIANTQEWTFQDRMEWICHLIKMSKNVATSLMIDDKVWTVLGQPHHISRTRESNIAIRNAQASEGVKAGRAADTEHQPCKRKRQKHINSAPTDPSPKPETAPTGPFPMPENAPTGPSSMPENTRTDRSQRSGSALRPLTDPERDAELIKLFYGPLPTRDDIENVGAVVISQGSSGGVGDNNTNNPVQTESTNNAPSAETSREEDPINSLMEVDSEL